LAAFEDADPSYSPSVNELCARIPGLYVSGFDGLVGKLERAGLVEVDRDPTQKRRDRYTLTL
jgi:DNA-binding MarR family transcriptional regulator